MEWLQEYRTALTTAALTGTESPLDKMMKSGIKTPNKSDIPQLFGTEGGFADNEQEIVIGFVGAVGVELKKAEDDFEKRLKIIGYRVIRICIAQDIIATIFPRESEGPRFEHERIALMMNLGNQARRRAADGGVLALGVAAEIKKRRPSGPSSAKGTAYIIHSLKHPEEVHRLRKMYPRGFYLVGVFASRERRIEHLLSEKRMTEAQAKKLMERDMKENDRWGQRLIDTFHLSDFFIRIEGDDDRLKNSIWRMVDVLFGHPYITPTFGEYAMFLAFAASLRSGDLSRQVGAVLARDGEILATGANDCPRAGGGLYWPFFNPKTKAIEDWPNGRDLTRGYDSNKAQQREIIEQIVEALPGQKQTKNRLRETLEDSAIRDLTEFGRVVHAEMEAMLSCARKGIAVKGATLYCTTFPCHNCAKHIIASGIERVVFVEPYLKSKAFRLHDDALSMSYGEEEVGEEGSVRKVRFEAFVGVGPRRFFDLFSMTLGMGEDVYRKMKTGEVVGWQPETSKQRISMITRSYRQVEEELAARFEVFRQSHSGFADEPRN